MDGKQQKNKEKIKRKEIRKEEYFSERCKKDTDKIYYENESSVKPCSQRKNLVILLKFVIFCKVTNDIS